MRSKSSPTETVVDLVRLLAAITGLLLLSYGSALVYLPAGFIVPGALLFGVGVVGAMRTAA